MATLPAGGGLVPQTTSLGDMINMARGIQQYQQAQQINPLEVQIRGQAARTGEINLGVAEQANVERQAMQQFFSNPENFQTDNRIDMNKINAAVPKIAPLTGADYISKYSTLSTAQSQATEAKQKMTQDQRQLFGQVAYTLGRAGVQDPKAYVQAFDDLASQFPQDTNIKQLADAYKTTWGQIPAGPGVPDMAIKGAQTLLTVPSQQTAFAPTVSVTPEGRTVTTTPQPGVAPPKTEIGVVGGIQTGAAAPGAAPAAAPAPSGMALPYPVRRADQPYIPEPTEKADQTAGEAYRTSLVSRLPALTTDRRNVEEVIKQAEKLGEQLIFKKGGIAGQLEMKGRMAIASDEYKMLAKDLANLQMSNMRALGQAGNTVAGIDLTRVASGDETVPPDVLRRIALRAQADMTNIEMQGNGAEAFKRQFGDNNMKAFQQNWSKNADSKIFEGINIVRDVTDPVKRDLELQRLFPDAGKRQEFLTKYRNLKKLSETGSL